MESHHHPGQGHPAQRQGGGLPAPERGEQLLFYGGGRSDSAAVPRGKGSKSTEVQLKVV